MKNLSLLIAILIFNLGTEIFAQKLYVWYPENLKNIPREEILRDDTLHVAIFDGRIISERSKVECNSEALMNCIKSEITQTYPNSIIIYDNNLYHKNFSKKNQIKIGISAYHAGFGVEINSGIGISQGNLSPMVFPKGMWNATTILYIESSRLDKVSNKVIDNISSKGNTWGYKTSKTALSETYLKSMQEMFFFIDSHFAN